MNLEIRIRSTDLTEALHAYVERRLHFSLGRFAGRLGAVKVRITDVNGPRGGVDKLCRITAELQPSGKLIVSQTVDTNLFAAIDHTTEHIGRSFGREVERHRSLKLTRETIRNARASRSTNPCTASARTRGSRTLPPRVATRRCGRR